MKHIYQICINSDYIVRRIEVRPPHRTDPPKCLFVHDWDGNRAHTYFYAHNNDKTWASTEEEAKQAAKDQINEELYNLSLEEQKISKRKMYLKDCWKKL
jgi:hypothetical protein